MSLPTLLRAVSPPYLHVLADSDSPHSGHVFDVVATLDPLFLAGLRLTEAHVYTFDPARWPEADSGAACVVVLDSTLLQTVAGAVARDSTFDYDDGVVHRDLKSRRRAELAENAAEEASVARAFRGTDPTPAVVLWRDDPRVARLGLSTFL